MLSTLCVDKMKTYHAPQEERKILHGICMCALSSVAMLVSIYHEDILHQAMSYVIRKPNLNLDAVSHVCDPPYTRTESASSAARE